MAMSAETTPSPAPTHVVHSDRRRRFLSATLPAGALARLETAFRSGPWYLDRWSRRKFRQAAAEVLASEAREGLILLGPRLPFDAPPPFGEFFEPIELGARDGQLRLLSGSAPTRQERQVRIVAYVLGIPLAIALLGALLLVLRRGSMRVVAVFCGVVLLVGSVVFGVQMLSRLGGRWFLLPGAVAIARPRGGGSGRLALCTRRDTCVLVRYVSTGKSTVLIAELWPADGRRWRRAMSHREAIGLLAAWQSPLPPPERERLGELAG